jgi:hypothetical protein
MFLDNLDSGMARWYDEGQLVAEVTSWAIAVSGSLDAVMQRVGGTVGGKVQLGIISRNGYHSLKIVSLDEVASGREADVWRTITSEGSLVERPPK